MIFSPLPISSYKSRPHCTRCGTQISLPRQKQAEGFLRYLHKKYTHDFQLILTLIRKIFEYLRYRIAIVALAPQSTISLVAVFGFVFLFSLIFLFLFYKYWYLHVSIDSSYGYFAVETSFLLSQVSTISSPLWRDSHGFTLKRFLRMKHFYLRCMFTRCELYSFTRPERSSVCKKIS